jgi:hypothetical protein
MLGVKRGRRRRGSEGNVAGYSSNEDLEFHDTCASFESEGVCVEVKVRGWVWVRRYVAYAPSSNNSLAITRLLRVTLIHRALEHPNTLAQCFSTTQAIDPEPDAASLFSFSLKLLAFVRAASSSFHLQLVIQTACFPS